VPTGERHLGHPREALCCRRGSRHGQQPTSPRHIFDRHRGKSNKGPAIGPERASAQPGRNRRLRRPGRRVRPAEDNALGPTQRGPRTATATRYGGRREIRLPAVRGRGCTAPVRVAGTGSPARSQRRRARAGWMLRPRGRGVLDLAMSAAPPVARPGRVAVASPPSRCPVSLRIPRRAGRVGRGERASGHEHCLRRVGPPALQPGSGLRRPGLLALDLGAPGRPAAGSPATHQRPPDRAARVQVVRPVGRSTWTRSARPGRGKPAPPGSPGPTPGTPVIPVGGGVLRGPDQLHVRR
jgi:hypothetical protein